MSSLKALVNIILPLEQADNPFDDRDYPHGQYDPNQNSYEAPNN